MSADELRARLTDILMACTDEATRGQLALVILDLYED